jgi:hypothetical protein
VLLTKYYSGENIESNGVWVRHLARMRESRGVKSVLVETRVGKKPLGRPRRRWVDSIKLDLQEVGLICLRIGVGGRHL